MRSARFERIRYLGTWLLIGGTKRALATAVVHGTLWGGLRAAEIDASSVCARLRNPFCKIPAFTMLVPASEGSSISLLIESRENAERRGVTPYCRLSGLHGIASDGYHIEFSLGQVALSDANHSLHLSKG
jgi:hypothetical protein